MVEIKKSTESRTGISVVHEGDKYVTFNILGAKLHEIDTSRAAEGVLIHRWFTDVFDEEIKEILGGHFLEVFKRSQCSQILADLSIWSVSWDGINDWLRDELMPKLQEAGLRNLVMVVAPTEESASNRFAAERFNEENDAVEKPFYSIEEAVAWLREQS